MGPPQPAVPSPLSPPPPAPALAVLDAPRFLPLRTCAGTPANIGWLSLRGRGEPTMATAAPPAEAAAADRAAAADKVFTNPLASHALPLDPPAAMLAGKEAALEPMGPLPSPISTSSIGAPSSSGGGSSSSRGGSGGGGDRHLRKLTQSLVEVLETMSSNVQPAAGGSRSNSRGARQGGLELGWAHGVVGGWSAAVHQQPWINAARQSTSPCLT